LTGLPRPCGPRNDKACGLLWLKELFVSARSIWLMDYSGLADTQLLHPYGLKCNCRHPACIQETICLTVWQRIIKFTRK
ncbi:MAG: hypothetical protein KGL01_03050, partial [Betaproteobacteria bacterium]|nr:hypothetical protein [Betaproteobacteria bacterium]